MFYIKHIFLKTTSIKTIHNSNKISSIFILLNLDIPWLNNLMIIVLTMEFLVLAIIGATYASVLFEPLAQSVRNMKRVNNRSTYTNVNSFKRKIKRSSLLSINNITRIFLGLTQNWEKKLNIFTKWQQRSEFDCEKKKWTKL